jgi:hypothetical protein
MNLLPAEQEVIEMIIDASLLTKEERALVKESHEFAISKIAEFCENSIPVLQSEVSTTEEALLLRKDRLQKLLAAASGLEGSEVDLDSFTFIGTHGIRLATGQNDQNNFSNLLVLLQISQVPDNQMVQVFDYIGNKADITYVELRKMLSEYGFYLYSKKQGN